MEHGHLADFSQFVQWAFYSLIGFLAMMVQRYMRDISNSIAELNQKMAQTLEKLDGHNGRIARLEDHLFSKGEK